MIGRDIVKTWSSTQKVISLLVGESEYYGIVKGATMGMGIRSLMADMGVSRDKPKLMIFSDSSTAKSISMRRGLGKVRHIEVCQLWVHQEVYNGRMDIVKVKGENNISDILTKHVDNQTLTTHLKPMMSERRSDRHPLNPQKAEDK